ncbi:hypothetical protein PRIPAC_79639 [Pristionchus pacificus]|uniref:G protein-coupled receptor n=1 Tax=Pristionchus pacificus TaxID=54126 RepID=A0A2A6CNW2_PRIPA|nr:hypothetical protein PRIPAC_79639 [Pristionchus pacificus]|eukprot:PDM79743.1 G protein-coupled receptor [Pristionchus pacificus]
MIETLDASSKALLDTVKLWTTTISIVLSVLAIYVLVRFLNQSTTLYRNLLVAITIMSVLSDVWLQIFVDPVFMFPLPCMHIQGALRNWTIISPVFGFEVWVSSISTVMLLYGFCVVYRNQNLSESWPENIRNRTNCVIPIRMCAIIAEYVLSIAFCGIFAVAVCAHTFYILSRFEFMSEKTRVIHRRLTKSLILQRRRLDRNTHLQVAIPILTILLPESVLVVRYILDIESPEFAPIILKCLGVHSIAHSLTVIASSHGFTRSLCGKTDERKITVSRTPGFRT